MSFLLFYCIFYQINAALVSIRNFRNVLIDCSVSPPLYISSVRPRAAHFPLVRHGLPPVPSLTPTWSSTLSYPQWMTSQSIFTPRQPFKTSSVIILRPPPRRMKMGTRIHFIHAVDKLPTDVDCKASPFRNVKNLQQIGDKITKLSNYDTYDVIHYSDIVFTY